MIRGIYTAVAGMLAQQHRHDTITNNIANIKTPGFKADAVPLRTFPEMLLYRLGGQPTPLNNSSAIGTLATGVLAEENMPYFKQGSIEETGLSTDLALGPDRQDNNQQNNAFFFHVRTPNGEERLTRDGRMTVDKLGQLVNGSGALVLDNTGQSIVVGSDDFNVKGNGDIVVSPNDPNNRTTIASLSIMAVPQNRLRSDLVKEGNGLYRVANGTTANLTQASTAFPNAQNLVRQGAYERSNVDPNQSMVDMMDAQRMYEANQRVVQMLDQVLSKTVNDVGRVV